MALTLGELHARLPGTVLRGDAATVVTGVTVDSRRAGPGSVFVAVRGSRRDGHDFLDAARAAGAAAVVHAADHEGAAAGPALVAGDTRTLPARIARLLHGEPDRSLRTVAVTGTNGKTTVSFLLQALLAGAEGACGLLGTIRYDDGAAHEPAPLTTPDGPTLYAWLARMRDGGCRAVALEVSSHALDQERVAGLELDAAVVTNLGRDHLDYHGDMRRYLAAKARIVERLRPQGGVLVLNAGDQAVAGIDAAGAPVVRFATVPDVAADLRVTDAKLDPGGTALELDWRGRPLALRSSLVGRFNVANLTAALAAGLALGLDVETCRGALASAPQVPGRLERFPLPGGGLAVVDYAHTPDAVAAVLATCDELAAGRLLVVFGCGGDRDRGKRPLMGAAAARGADRAWITADNPRSEDPAAICVDIAGGFDAVAGARATGREIVLDRAAAIAAALDAAAEGDVVVIAGKGHEDYQLVGDEVRHLDDRELVRAWCAEAAP